MIFVKCDRPGCESLPAELDDTNHGRPPAGWLALWDGARWRLTCSETCMDIVWGQKTWRGRRKVMEELPVSETALLPKI